ncbi:hypothetical protein SAMN04487934_10830 [Eubacterium ruminantium]|nr:hypothetical protein SAMN04487934_10830 [Eubacterium ruminantium]
MKKKNRTPMEMFSSFSWIYVIAAAFYGLGAVVCNLVPGFSDMLNKNFTDKNPMAAFNGAAIGTVLIYIWYFWLARRVVSGKSKGTLYMVLLILGVVGKIVSMVISKSAASISSFDFIIDALGLYYYYKVRKEEGVNS